MLEISSQSWYAIISVLRELIQLEVKWIHYWYIEVTPCTFPSNSFSFKAFTEQPYIWVIQGIYCEKICSSIICLQSLNHRDMDTYFNHWSRADAEHRACLRLLLHFVIFFFFFVTFTAAECHNVQKQSSKKSISGNQKLAQICWHPSWVFFLLFFFYVLALCMKKMLIWMLHTCWLCGVVALQCDFCAVLFVNWELNSTKIRLIPRDLSTECTHHVVKCNLCL